MEMCLLGPGHREFFLVALLYSSTLLPYVYRDKLVILTACNPFNHEKSIKLSGLSNSQQGRRATPAFASLSSSIASPSEVIFALKLIVDFGADQKWLSRRLPLEAAAGSAKVTSTKLLTVLCCGHSMSRWRKLVRAPMVWFTGRRTCLLDKS